MPGVFGKGLASIGGMTNKLLRGQSMYSGVNNAKAALAAAPRGSRRTALDGVRTAQSALDASNMKTGRRVAGAAIGMTGIGMANRSGSGARGGYQPRRSVMPVPQNGMPM
jgi:L,D-peptidoglycan transpeptidase YkuD (ErfK/YbiS/YcfS/YnhG family)